MLKLLFPILIAVFLLAGCDDEPKVQRYEVTKPAGYNWPESELREASLEIDEIKWVWDVPKGWIDAPELPDQILADYRFKGSTESLPGRATISKFDGDAGGIEANVLRWQKQVFVTTESKLGPKDSKTGPIPSPANTGMVTFVDIHGQYQGEHYPTRIYAAIVQVPASDGRILQTWVFKLAGDEQVVENNRDGLVQMALTFRPSIFPRPDFPGAKPTNDITDDRPQTSESK